MGRQWSRHHASLEDIKRCRKEILGKYPNATEIFFDEYLVDTHQNDYGCSANKFYYGAVMETKDGRFQAATAYGRIGEHLENRKAFGGLKAFDEGVFTNFDSAKDKLNVKLIKKKRGKRCSKCKTRQSYSPFAPKNAETFEAVQTSFQEDNKTDSWKTGVIRQALSSGCFTKGYAEYIAKEIGYEAESFGAEREDTLIKGFYCNSTEACRDTETVVRWRREDKTAKCLECDYVWKMQTIDEIREFGAESMSPQVFGKLAGQYPQPPNNPSAVGGFMDDGFEWTVNQAETLDKDLWMDEHISMDMPKEMWNGLHDQYKGERGNVHFDSGKIVRVDDEYYIVIKANQQMGIKNVYYRNWDFTLGPYPYTAKGWFNGYMKWKQVPQRGRDWAPEVQEALGDYTDGYRPTAWGGAVKNAEDYYCTKCDEGFSSITPTDEGQFCNDCLPTSATPHNEMDATTQREEFGVECENCDEKITTKSPYKCVHHKICKVCVKEFGSCPMCDSNRNFNSSSSIVSKVKNNWLNSLIGLGVALVGYDYLKKKTFNSDTLIENPNTGDITPADYEEIVVESTGYVVPIIPVSLDGSFMGSRFHALATDRYIYDSPEGIGAHIDIAMNRNTTFLPNEQSLVQASEAPGQSPYNSILPNGQENKDFPLRVIHETTTVSLDAGVAPYLPTDLSGYTGQQFIPTSVYEDMLNIGISGQTPAFKTPITQEVGANHFGSRIANPDMLANVGGPLKESVNGDYTDGNNTMTLSQWSIENQVQQISDTEALVIERGSGLRKMIRRV